MLATQLALAGKYEVLEQIGHGAYSVVWKARDLRTDKLVAIKEVHNLGERDVLKRLLREIRLLKHFRNQSYIVTLVEVFTTQQKHDFERLFVVCELMDMDLDKLIQSPTPITNDHVKLFIYQLLAGLKCMHSANVLHRDLKPKNILVNHDCNLKICDLGMGRSDIPSGRSLLKMTMLTEVSTLYYRAPDGILNIQPSRTHQHNETDHSDISHSAPEASYTAAVDLWACGCIMAELLLRRPIFPGRTNKDLLEMIIKTVGSPTTELLEKIPDGVYKRCILSLGTHTSKLTKNLFPANTDALALDVLSKMLELDPEKRITVDEALRHPYFSELYDENDIPQCKVFSFVDDDDDDSKTIADYKELIWNEINNPDRDAKRELH